MRSVDGRGLVGADAAEAFVRKQQAAMKSVQEQVEAGLLDAKALSAAKLHWQSLGNMTPQERVQAAMDKQQMFGLGTHTDDPQDNGRFDAFMNALFPRVSDFLSYRDSAPAVDFGAGACLYALLFAEAFPKLEVYPRCRTARRVAGPPARRGHLPRL